MSTTPTSPLPPIDEEKEARKVAFGAFVGTALEWYDFFLFGTAASLVFNRLYFVNEDPLVATIAAFASFAVGFIARPLGAILFGAMGDRVGRKKTLIVTVVLIGTVTALIGVLPTYLTIGIAAPILLTLLRLVQGIAVGGEWGGAVTLAVEHAPAEKRGRYGVMPQIGSPIGTLLSSSAFLAVGLLPPEQFDSWGWRLPFLAAIPLLGIAVWLRRQVEESPLFEQMLEEDSRAKTPLRSVFTEATPALLIGAGSTLLGVGGFYLATTFIIAYGTTTLGLSRTVLLSATFAAAAAEIVVLILAGRVVERIGAGKVTLIGGLASAAFAYPMFLMVDTRQTVLVVSGVVIAICLLSISYAASGVLLTSLFPAKLRYTGVAISSNIASVVSGFVPLVATSVLAAAGGASWAPALVLVALALTTAGSGALADKTPDASEQELKDSARRRRELRG